MGTQDEPDVALQARPGPEDDVARVGYTQAAVELLRELLTMPGVEAIWSACRGRDRPALLVPLHLRKDGVEVRLFTTVTTLGTPTDITLQELRIESYFPADEASDAVVRALAAEA